MNIWAIVPVKPLNRSKSRLAPVLSGKQRETLSRQMLEQTLGTLNRVTGIGGILVISRDNAVLSLARQFDVQTVQESGSPELNDALGRATQLVTTWGAQGILIVASDMPLMLAKDIEGMLALANQPRIVVIASDRHGEGTNALLIQPPGLISYSYGPNSFRRHVAYAKEAGIPVRVYGSPTMSLDVDIPEDLKMYQDIVNHHEADDKEPVWLTSV
ncbi:MAG: 2-phospho-L-lactate guanylyltransferase [Anaerolineae bacterium]|nr:2-phospho-L-lactate guanylyltransferase [Anaerolineae bacterium]